MVISEDQKRIYKEILDKCASNRSSDEVHIYEDLYNVNAQEAFENLCEANLGFYGMRLDLFLDGLSGDKDGYIIQKEKEVPR